MHGSRPSWQVRLGVLPSAVVETTATAGARQAAPRARRARAARAPGRAEIAAGAAELPDRPPPRVAEATAETPRRAMQRAELETAWPAPRGEPAGQEETRMAGQRAATQRPTPRRTAPRMLRWTRPPRMLQWTPDPPPTPRAHRT